MSTSEGLTGRQLYRRKRQQRETVVFTLCAALMVISLIVGMLMALGIIPLPFGNTFSEKKPVARISQVPCVPENAKPTDPKDSTVTVLNGTDKAGLATEVADNLKKRGYKVGETGNAPTGEFTGGARIRTGTAGVAAAYTLAVGVPGATVVLDGSRGSQLELTLGNEFTKLEDATHVAQSLKKEGLKSPRNCLPLGLKSAER
ncbi:MAG: LytR C-terminal domain-containing protein [Winkia neuii]|uniref:LytR C-terminal domain-containing protein n=1 Tax=Winkia neuii TaxID=33007 RepID=UPI000A50DACB|nr:LytR C-terminal domain-containing protein [Winkia neuii]MDK8100547.1 LytR C-terminal domain-containing protein [Winkia neuii]MDU3135714.1 LytR C-terminal domain-containing protein [Winkia neuii]